MAKAKCPKCNAINRIPDGWKRQELICGACGHEHLNNFRPGIDAHSDIWTLATTRPGCRPFRPEPTEPDEWAVEQLALFGRKGGRRHAT